ncbi:GlxA family transcriptional regulator [Aliamphritea ceti]|uniref:GlxA family transcriptional regulator n=1 Tax=Aliamphritea ceti TaxID=1524258 RepID=UPI0021C44200|nr:GlxA family transcriptional regulator [Aliamphritea ceti]
MSDSEPLQRRFAFVLLPSFNMMALSAAIEPLRVANMLSGQDLYRWQLFSAGPGQVQASNSTQITVDGDLAAADAFMAAGCDTLFICASWYPEQLDNEQLFGWLRQHARSGLRLGGIDTGAIVLARAHLLDGFRATANYDVIAGFAEDHPRVTVTDHLFEADQNRMTCSAGTAPIDMMLLLMHEHWGEEITNRVSRHLFYQQLRSGGESQTALVREFGYDFPKQLQYAIHLMERNIESRLMVREVAEQTGTSLRTLERLFREHTQMSPAMFYLRLRLEKGRQYLLHTRMSVLQVAVACGFLSQEHFARRYRDVFGRSPRDERAVAALQTTADMASVAVDNN